MRDPIVVENELQHKDPAVVAVASSGFAYQPHIGQALSTSSGNIVSSNSISNPYSQHIYPNVSICSIPTQTFTNPNYNTLLPGNGYVPVPLSHQIIPEQVSIRNVGPDTLPIQNDNLNELINEKSEFSNRKEASNLPTSQDAIKPSTIEQVDNGNYKRNPRGNRNNSRGTYGGNSVYRGRGGKNFGYYNGNGNNGHSSNTNNGNFNPNRMNNRHNGGGIRSGPYRQDKSAAPRNQNYNQQQTTSSVADK